MKHSFPQIGMTPSGAAVRFERNERHRVVVNDCLQVVARQIGFVCAHLTHGEVASRGLYQSLELRTVVGVRVGNFDAGHDVGFDSAHQMNLNPGVALHQFRIGVFGFGPLNESTSCEARRVNSKVTLHGLQGQATDFDQLFKEWRQRWILKVTRNRIEVWRSRQETFAVCVSQVRAKATAREGAVNLKRTGEDHVGQGQARTPERLDRFFDAFAEFVKQRQKAILFVALRSVIGRPLLLVGFPDRDRLSDGLSLTVIDVFAPDNYFSREDHNGFA